MLGFGLFWTVVLRVPVILNAEDHLDSDLAVDGLTLLDAVHGQWRWHYPGTPYMGILPMLLSYPQAVVWGGNPITLVSGGTVIWVLVVLSTFWLAWRAFGPAVAGWSIVPLVFSSPGTIWLSGRITGGHLLTLVWHTVAFAGLHACLTRGGWLRAAGLGLWCGLGLYLDAMFLFTLAGLVPAAILTWLLAGRSRAGLGLAGVFLAGMVIGLLPREIGRWVDPYDAYPSQFAATFEARAILEHARLLSLVCIPRLIAGIELPDLQQEFPMLSEGMSQTITALLADGTLSPSLSPSLGFLGRIVCGALSLALFATSLVWLALGRASPGDPGRRAVRWGVLGSAGLILAAFLVNRNIYNSDNYRYLIFALTPWSLGFGSLLHDLASSGRAGRWLAGAILLPFVVVMTVTTLSWYRDVRHYLDREFRPSRVAVWPWEKVIVYDPEGEGYVEDGRFASRVDRTVTHVFGPYWEVYRLAFRSGGRVAGIPLPMYPNRFPGWSRGLGAGQGTLMVLQPLMAGWRDALVTVWKAERRDVAELNQIRIVIPSRDSSRR
jgi:hypothetical protein